MLSEEQVRKYQIIYKKCFGKEIDQAEAYAQGIALVRLVELIYKPMSETEYKQLQERRKQTNDYDQPKNN